MWVRLDTFGGAVGTVDRQNNIGAGRHFRTGFQTLRQNLTVFTGVAGAVSYGHRQSLSLGQLCSHFLRKACPALDHDHRSLCRRICRCLRLRSRACTDRQRDRRGGIDRLARVGRNADNRIDGGRLMGGLGDGDIREAVGVQFTLGIA